MKNILLSTLVFITGFLTKAVSAENSGKIGIVNFNTCIAESKYGKQEQNNLDALKKQLTTLITETETQLRAVVSNLNDPDHMDGLSPEGEQQLQMEYQKLGEQYNQYQNQYSQVMQQANLRIYQTLSNYINRAAEEVAKEKKLALVINKEAVFYSANQLDVTSVVIKHMDENFTIGEQVKENQTAAIEQKSNNE